MHKFEKNQGFPHFVTGFKILQLGSNMYCTYTFTKMYLVLVLFLVCRLCLVLIAQFLSSIFHICSCSLLLYFLRLLHLVMFYLVIVHLIRTFSLCLLVFSHFLIKRLFLFFPAAVPHSFNLSRLLPLHKLPSQYLCSWFVLSLCHGFQFFTCFLPSCCLHSLFVVCDLYFFCAVGLYMFPALGVFTIYFLLYDWSEI